MSVIATTDTQNYENIADGLRTAGDLSNYKTELEADAEIFDDISDALQSKTGQQEPYAKDELAQAVSDLPTDLISKTITQNGIYSANSDNADGYDVVTVDVPQNIEKLIDGTITEVETNVTVIRPYAFFGCLSLISIVAPNVTLIGDNAFYTAGLLSTNPFRFEKCETIGVQAFRNMSALPSTGLQRIVLFPNLKTISGNSFQSSNVLTGMSERILKQKCILTSTDVSSSYSTIFIPNSLLSWYQNATNWVDRINSYPDSVKTIEDNLVYLKSRGYTEEELLSIDYDTNEVS